ncbi:MAG: TonB-dependent receptor [Bacteroidia bacterium]
MLRIYSFFLLLLSFGAIAQNAVIKGKVFNSKNNEAIPFANVVIQGTTTGATTDIDGNYEIKNLNPGLYNLEVSYVGFKKKVIFEVQATNAKAAIVNIALEETATDLKTVEITGQGFNKTEESPVSLRTIGVAEIERNPGGNRDISAVIRNFPGVASTPAFRNDIIIRGGAPNENRFYLDGVEVPNINHFATQGSSGGPVGLINVNFIREVDFYSGAFPAARGNALSSVFEFKQIDGNPDKLNTRLTVGSSDFGATFDGPIGKNANFIFSVRRSYLQFLFKAIGLPFLPTYNDYQYKFKWKLNDKNEISFIGLGALDVFELNKSVNDNITDPETLERNNYILGNIPINDQWNYTSGLVYKNYRDKAFTTVVLSRNMLKNIAYKHEDNDKNKPKTIDYYSTEEENKFRIENTSRNGSYKSNIGLNLETAEYKNSTNNLIPTPIGVQRIQFSSSLHFIKYGFFAQLSRGFLGERLVLSAGLRSDGNNYNEHMANLFNQLSPRFSASYSLTTKWSINANIGRYYQLPAYTVMGYRDAQGVLVNNKNLKYIQSNHIVSGLEYNTSTNARFTLEGFYKTYANYPFLLRDSISLANLGGDFGVIGNEPAISNSTGRSYGIEFLAQQKLMKGFFGILAYTFVRSEFKDKNGNYVPTAWDSRHIVNLTAGKKFKKNWQVGVRGRFSGGAPFTPYDVATSSLVQNWNVSGRGVLDFNQLNTGRLPAFHGMDLRIDKEYFFNKWSLNLYFDVQNVYNFQSELQPTLLLDRDINGNPQILNPNDPIEQQRYKTKVVKNTTGTVLPSIGIILDF